MGLERFREIWAVDFEFRSEDGDPPDPICLVAREVRSGRTLRVFGDELRAATAPPYPTDEGALVVAYFASAEIGCHLSLGWELPANVLDLFVEFRGLTNGRPPATGCGLVGALTYFGLPAIDADEKQSMRDLALRRGPWSAAERDALLDYCESDVVSVERLLSRMAASVDVDRALLRGRYMIASACMEHVGVPIDIATYNRIRRHRDDIRARLIADIDLDGLYDGGAFRSARWEAWLGERGLPWPRRADGRLALDDDSFRAMGRAYPSVRPIHELRATLAQLRTIDLRVGRDGRSRCLLSPFSARTGRNQPSTSKFVFSLPSWLRGLIQPAPGRALAYIDWSQQEFGIAAALSGDPAMRAAYEAGDPYLAFAKQAGAVPPSATKESHQDVREQYKACALALQYGMGADALGMRIGESPSHGRVLIDHHRRLYPTFWSWSDAAVDCAVLHGSLSTVFGWPIHIADGGAVNPRSLQNFPVQANGAEMLRIAVCLALEGEVAVCAPVHDALLIEAPEDSIDSAVELTRRAMARASEIVLGGLRLRSDVRIVRHPERLLDRGAEMWRRVLALLPPDEDEQ